MFKYYISKFLSKKFSIKKMFYKKIFYRKKILEKKFRSKKISVKKKFYPKKYFWLKEKFGQKNLGKASKKQHNKLGFWADVRGGRGHRGLHGPNLLMVMI